MPATTQTVETVEENVETTVETEETKTEPTLQQLQEQLLTVQSELAAKEELLHKVRKFEKENKEAAQAAAKKLAEQGEFKTLYETEKEEKATWQAKYTNVLVENVVHEHLKQAGAVSITSVAKLLDKSKIVIADDKVDAESVKSLIEELRTSDPALFVHETKPVPPPKKAGEGDPVGGFEKEIRAATTQKQIETVMRKYGKL